RSMTRYRRPSLGSVRSRTRTILSRWTARSSKHRLHGPLQECSHRRSIGPSAKLRPRSNRSKALTATLDRTAMIPDPVTTAIAPTQVAEQRHGAAPLPLAAFVIAAIVCIASLSTANPELSCASVLIALLLARLLWRPGE